MNRFSSQPLILLVDPDDEILARGRDHLVSDCTPSFDVVAAGEIAAAQSSLEEAHARRQSVALLILRHTRDEDQLRALLRRAKEVSPGVHVILYGGTSDPVFAQDAKREGLVDDHISQAWEEPEVALDPLLRDALRAWEGGSATRDVVEIIGDQWHPRCHDVKDLLARHRVPYRWIDVATRADDQGSEWRVEPRIVFPDGTELVNPDDEALAQKLGFGTRPEASFYDVVIVGGGPAGLGAAVYASSEGLRTVIIECAVPGGQAGTSALIENYLGFPDGISGAELASRAVLQAEKFGTEILLTKSASRLRDDQGYRVVTLEDGTDIVSHTVLLSMGVAYTRFTAEGAERLSGSGVYYGAAAAEAARFRGRDVCLLGSGNSAGQAALLLARYARRLTIITIDDGLEATMSRYLVDRLHAFENVRLMPKTTVVEVRGEDRVEGIVIEGIESKERRELHTDALFVWIGGKPRTDWLAGTVARDDEGFIITGRDLRRTQLEGWPLDRWPMHLETTMQGVFVAGDVRHGSAKRVGSAVGEGAMAVQLIQNHLRER